MKRRIVSMAFLTGVLFMCVACSANASTPELPPENNVEVEETVKKEPLAQSNEELPEIPMEDLEAIFEDVYLGASHPDDWNLEFCITDEVGKISKAIPESMKAPSDLRAIYTDWRTARVEADQQEESPVSTFTFDEVSETVYATGEVNVRSGPGTEYEKVGSLSWGEGVTRTGIGTGASSNWSRIEFSDGVVAYVASSYLSATKPVAQQQTTSQKPSGSGGTTTSQNNGGSQTSSNTSNSTTPAQSSSSTVERTAENNYGFEVPPGYHVEMTKNGKYRLVNDETGYSEIFDGVGMMEQGYVAGEGQITSEDHNYHDWVEWNS